MADISKISPDDGSTILNIKDSKSVHFGAESKGYVGKNLIQNNEVSQTINNVTFTVNADKSITANGLNNGNTSNFFLYDGVDIVIDQPCILSGCPNGGSESTYKISMRRKGTQIYVDNTGGETNIGVGTYDRLLVQVASNYNANNLTFYPMLRLASISDATYEPWYMTNRELTALSKRTKLSDSDDLDNILEYGNYYWENLIPLHSPENQNYASMNVYPCGDIIHQEIIRGAGGGASIYVRRYQTNSWSSWYKFTGTGIS